MFNVWKICYKDSVIQMNNKESNQATFDETHKPFRNKQKELIPLTSSMPGILLTDSFFNELCNFLSSVVAVLWTTFFFLRAVPFPPIRTCSCSCFNFSGFIIIPMKNDTQILIKKQGSQFFC